MRVFVAGASGAIGRPLVRQLVAAGHEVTGMTRRGGRAAEIRSAGAPAAVCDAFDVPALNDAVIAALPEVVVNQLTALPDRVRLRRGEVALPRAQVARSVDRRKGVAAMATSTRGASNEKAKRELGWQPRYSSWRQGFREALG